MQILIPAVSSISLSFMLSPIATESQSGMCKWSHTRFTALPLSNWPVYHFAVDEAMLIFTLDTEIKIRGQLFLRMDELLF